MDNSLYEINKSGHYIGKDRKDMRRFIKYEIDVINMNHENKTILKINEELKKYLINDVITYGVIPYLDSDLYRKYFSKWVLLDIIR